MRITIVTGFFLPVPPLRGGATEKVWYQLARRFAAAGHTVTFVSRAWPGLPDRESIDGVTHHRLPGFNHTRHLALNLALDLLWGLRVTRALPSADAVICNTVALPVWLRRWRPAAGRVAAVVARMPKGQTRFYGGVDLLLALSTSVAERIRQENPRLSHRIRPFPFPIDWALHRGAAHRRVPLTVGFIGRLHPEKGIPLLLAAAERLAQRSDLPDWRLELTGPVDVPSGGGGDAWLNELLGSLRPALRSRLTLRPPEYNPTELARCYGGIDVFCYPSVAEQGETFGVAVAEAMAAGCAPVVSRLACFRDFVENHQTGLIFDHSAPDAVNQLADAIAGLLADPARRQAIASQAQSAVRRFDYEEVGRQLLADLGAMTGAARG